MEVNVEVLAWVFGSVLLVSLISLVGVFTLTIKERRLHNILIYFISFSAGALLGDVFIHLLPELVEEQAFTLTISFSIIAGIALSFALEKIVRWNHHHHLHHHTHHHTGRPVEAFAYMNIIGDAAHNFLDGLIIGTSYLISIPVGIATSLAVVFHEIPQEIGDFGVLLKAGLHKSKALLANFLSALTAVLGAAIAFFAGSQSEQLTRFLIPLTAGAFIYIAASDLIPELHKESGISSSLKQIFFFLLGVAIMTALLYTENIHALIS